MLLSLFVSQGIEDTAKANSLFTKYTSLTSPNKVFLIIILILLVYLLLRLLIRLCITLRSEKKLCFHKTILVTGSVEDAQLCEPGGEPRNVKIGMVRTYCRDCDKTFKITPGGVVYDEIKGIDRTFPTETLEVPPNVRKELLS